MYLAIRFLWNSALFGFVFAPLAAVVVWLYVHEWISPTLATVIFGALAVIAMALACAETAREHWLARQKAFISRELNGRQSPDAQTVQSLERDWPRTLMARTTLQLQFQAMRLILVCCRLGFLAIVVAVLATLGLPVSGTSKATIFCLLGVPIAVVAFFGLKVLNNRIADRANQMLTRQTYERQRQGFTNWLATEVTPSESKAIAARLRRDDPARKILDACLLFLTGLLYFGSLLGFAVVAGRGYFSSPFACLSCILLPLYVVFSFVAFVAMDMDKRAAKEIEDNSFEDSVDERARRISELQLHVFELLGGSPGSFIAQKFLHHKTRKLSYQIVFWMVVLMHCAFWIGCLIFQAPLNEAFKSF